MDFTGGFFLFFISRLKVFELIGDSSIKITVCWSPGSIKGILDGSLFGLECLPSRSVGCRNCVNLIGHELIILTYSFINK